MCLNNLASYKNDKVLDCKERHDGPCVLMSFKVIVSVFCCVFDICH